MGVSIHYSGKLREATELHSLIEEVRDIAIEKGWHHFVFEDQFENNQFTIEPDLDQLFGIMLSPENCEPLCFSFLSDSRMCGLINFKVIEINNAIDEDLTYSLFTKTQYAGLESHKEIIHLLDYISKKYLIDFECYDETGYWETGDENLLKETFNRYEGFIEGFATSLEVIPPKDGENLEDHLLRLANTTNDRVQNSIAELPNLSTEEENQFKRMKINLEHGGFFGKEDANIPPEIEGQFLDYIMEFEKQFKDAPQISVFEKIGKPIYAKSIDLSPEELEVELENLFNLLEQNNLFLEVLYDYENESLLIYNFITEEFFNKEINDISIPGMNTNFTYEDFHPNHAEDLKQDSNEFWQSYFKNDSEHFEEFTLGDLLNSEELSDFRYSFEAFKKIKINILEVNFDIEEKKATTKVHLKFDAVIDAKNRIPFDCESIMDFYYQHGYWYLGEVSLPTKK